MGFISRLSTRCHSAIRPIEYINDHIKIQPLCGNMLMELSQSGEGVEDSRVRVKD